MQHLAVHHQGGNRAHAGGFRLGDTGRGLANALAEMGEDANALEGLLGDLLRTVQRQEDVPGFGLCRTCRFHQQRDGEPFCGLTQEPLARPSIELICREHQPREEAA